MTSPTHALIDGRRHVVTSIEDGGGLHTHRIRFGCGLAFDLRGERELDDARWHPSDVAPPCATCADVESGRRAAILPTPPPKPRRVQADIATGLPCPTAGCGGHVYVRRASGGATCNTNGHEFTVPEVLAGSVGLIERLARGAFGGDR